MEVDQKHITTIRMHDAKGGDIHLVKEGADYQLQLSSKNNVVNISLGLQDVRKLCQQIIQLDIEENWRSHCVTPPEFKSFFFNGAPPRSIHDTMTSWYARMAGEMADKSGKQEASVRQ